MKQSFEYIIVYTTPQRHRAGLYKGMTQGELERVIHMLRQEGCLIEKIEIIR